MPRVSSPAAKQTRIYRKTTNDAAHNKWSPPRCGDSKEEEKSAKNVNVATVLLHCAVCAQIPICDFRSLKKRNEKTAGYIYILRSFRRNADLTARAWNNENRKKNKICGHFFRTWMPISFPKRGARKQAGGGTKDACGAHIFSWA